MKKVYLATPYSDEDPQVEAVRFFEVTRVAALLIKSNVIVFSPISHCHPMAIMHNLPKDWNFWYSFDKSFIKWADEVHVLMQEGWEESRGVQAEIEIAHELRKLVRYLESHTSSLIYT